MDTVLPIFETNLDFGYHGSRMKAPDTEADWK